MCALLLLGCVTLMAGWDGGVLRCLIASITRITWAGHGHRAHRSPCHLSITYLRAFLSSSYHLAAIISLLSTSVLASHSSLPLHHTLLPNTLLTPLNATQGGTSPDIRPLVQITSAGQHPKYIGLGKSWRNRHQVHDLLGGKERVHLEGGLRMPWTNVTSKVGVVRAGSQLSPHQGIAISQAITGLRQTSYWSGENRWESAQLPLGKCHLGE